MGTDVRLPPSRVAAVSVGVLWGRKHRDRRPEQLPVTEVGVVVVRRDELGFEVESRRLIEGAELTHAPQILLELALPLLAGNAMRFDWVALGALTPVDQLIARTIDIHSVLRRSVAEIVDAEGVAAFPVGGEYGVLHPHRIAETNLGQLPGSGDGPLGEAALTAEIWHHLLLHRRARLAGRTHALDDEQLALLRGERSAFADADAWRAMLAERPEPTPYTRRTRHPVTFPRIDQRYV